MATDLAVTGKSGCVFLAQAMTQMLMMIQYKYRILFLFVLDNALQNDYIVFIGDSSFIETSHALPGLRCRHY